MASQTFQEAQRTDFQDFVVYLAGSRYVQGHFSNVRIDRSTLPEGWHAYDIRDDDSNGEPCQLRNGYIRVNHFGTFTTQEDIGLPVGESLYITEDENNMLEDEFTYSFE